MNQSFVNSEVIVFGLGSNLGNRFQFLESAISMLKSDLELHGVSCSEIYENPAMLPKNAPKEWNKNFLNQAVAGKIKINQPCNLDFALQILEITKKIEINLGRKTRPRWAPREIDIDILAIGQNFFNCELLQIPHPGLFDRDFFRKTFKQIAPELFEKLKITLKTPLISRNQISIPHS